MRVIRLALGIVILIQAIVEQDTLMIAAGSILTLLPVLNLGCCAGGQCYTPKNYSKNQTEDETIEFIEVKK